MDTVAWTNIFGGLNSCQLGPPSELWWHHVGNISPNFDDFTPTAGWSVPNMKQYKNAQSVCGMAANLNYIPN